MQIKKKENLKQEAVFLYITKKDILANVFFLPAPSGTRTLDK